MPDPVKQATDDSITDILSMSRESMQTMEADAEEFFANRNAAQADASVAPKQSSAAKTTSPPPTRGAQGKSGVEKNPSTNSSSTSLSPESPPSTAKAQGLVPGPIVNAPAGKSGGKPETAASEAAATPDFSDIPQEYTPGQVRAPQWKRLHEAKQHFADQAATLGEEVNKLKGEIATLRSSPTKPSPDIERTLATLQQERDQLQTRLEAIAVERSPRFEAIFKPRMEAAIVSAKEAVGPTAAAKIEQLLQMPRTAFRDEQISQIAAELPSLQQHELFGAVADLNRIAVEKQQLASKSSEFYKTWSAEEQATAMRQQEQRTAEANQVFDATLKDWEVAGLTEEEVATARQLYSGKNITFRDASNAVMWAIQGPKMAATAQQANARIAELEKELSKLRTKQPNTAPDTATGDAEEQIDPNTSYMDRIAAEAVKNGFLRR